MLVPLGWLKEYTDITCDARELAKKMTFTGSKAEGVADLGGGIINVAAGKLLTFDRHPDADKLFVSSVDVGGGETVQIVTGADNIKAGDIVPIALDNSTLPGGVHIKATKMRGIVSQGMMCSIQELHLLKADYPEAPDDGILVLDPSVEPGADVREVLGFDDFVIDFEITTNRPDCLGVLGLAREAAATMGTAFKAPAALSEGYKRGNGGAGESGADLPHVTILNNELCCRYTARMVTGVEVKSSPEWMKKRLRNSGVRPINNIVDVTNYVMLETGQPLHAFDARYVAGNEIIIRNAARGEKIQTLDGGERELDTDMLVIADSEKPIAVAGVMGGEHSGIFPDTKTVIIESANFNGISIRRTARKLGMRTESSSRFEKGIDPNMALPAADRAVELIEALGAGRAEYCHADIYPVKRAPSRVGFEPERINALLGTDISRGEMIKILRGVDLAYDENTNEIVAPTYRMDINMGADLAEEVARFYDYNNIEATLRPGTVTTAGVRTPLQKLRQAASNTVLACGYSEIYTFTFQGPKAYDKLLLPPDSPLRRAVRVENPFNEDSCLMRTTAVPEMLKTISDNYSQRIDSAAFFEFASVFHPQADQNAGVTIRDVYKDGVVDLDAADKFLPVQNCELTLGAFGDGHSFFTVKGVFEALFGALGIKSYQFTRCTDIPYMHPGRSAYIMIGNKAAGYFGETHPDIADAFSMPEHALAGAVLFDALYQAAVPGRSYRQPAKFPPVPRDLALLADVNTPAGDIRRVIKKHGGAILESAEAFDVYTGPQVPDGKKSIAFSLMFRSEDRTLTDDDVASKISAILNALEKEFGVKLRV